MFDIGIQELIIIFIVALLVVGPKKLPEVGRQLGRGMAELKRALQGFKDSMTEEENLLKKEIPDFKEDLVGPLRKDLEASLNSKDLEARENPETTGGTKAAEDGEPKEGDDRTA